MSECCTVTQTVPGPRGLAGGDGEDGIDGINAFTHTTAAFTMPAVGAPVTVAVEEANWISPNGTSISGQNIFIQNAGYFTGTTILSSTSIIVTNLGYSVNAPPGTIIPSSSKVSPAGVIGLTGPAAPLVGGGVTGGVGDPNGIIFAAGWWIYIDLPNDSLWVHSDAASTSVWRLKIE